MHTCPIAQTLEELSKKWMLLILHDLQTHSHRRFTQLIVDYPELSSKTLAVRLVDLEKMGLISRTKFKETPPRVEYSLTQKGRELNGCFKYLEIWAQKYKTG